MLSREHVGAAPQRAPHLGVLGYSVGGGAQLERDARRGPAAARRAARSRSGGARRRSPGRRGGPAPRGAAARCGSGARAVAERQLRDRERRQRDQEDRHERAPDPVRRRVDPARRLVGLDQHARRRCGSGAACRPPSGCPGRARTGSRRSVRFDTSPLTVLSSSACDLVVGELESSGRSGSARRSRSPCRLGSRPSRARSATSAPASCTIRSKFATAAWSPLTTGGVSSGLITPSPTTSVSVRASRIAWSVAVRRSMYVPTVPITTSSSTTEKAHW